MSLVLQDKLVLSPETAEHLQEEIDLLQAASDCADVVATHADLDNYDTSTLTDNAVIKVLRDEDYDNAQTYWRWSTSTETFTLEGQLGPYVNTVSNANQVYVTNGSGDQAHYLLSVNAIGNSFAYRNSNAQVRVNLTPSDDNDATSKKYVDDQDALKQEKTKITTISTATPTIALADNTIFNCTTSLTSLAFTLPTEDSVDFSCQVNFTSGSTATTAPTTTSGTIEWIGDNVNEANGFVPRASCKYTIIFYYDGTNYRGVVQGISL